MENNISERSSEMSLITDELGDEAIIDNGGTKENDELLENNLMEQSNTIEDPWGLNDQAIEKIVDEKSPSGTSTTDDTQQLEKDSDISSVDQSAILDEEDEEEEEECDTPSEDSLLHDTSKPSDKEPEPLVPVVRPITPPASLSIGGSSEGLLGLPQASLLHTESLKCSAPGCRHQAQNQGGLILHLHSHFKFEIATLGTTGETKFCYVLGKYQCLLCPLETPHRVVFGEHVRHHLLNHPYSCGHCSEGVESVTLLRQHNRQSHRLLLAKLVVNENEHVDAIMSRLGPQAPRIEKDVALPKSTIEKTPPKADQGTGPRKLPGYCDVDKKDITATDGSQKNICEINTSAKQVTKATAPAMKQNFKYLLTSNAKFCCSECRYSSGDVPAFTVHIFNDIHQALRNVCGDCNQKGINTVDFTPCPIVDQIIRALIKQKDQLIGGQSSVSSAKKKLADDGAQSLGKAQWDKSSSELQSASPSTVSIPNKDPSSPFEETMAMLKDLSSPRSGTHMNFGLSPESTDVVSETGKSGTSDANESIVSIKMESNEFTKSLSSEGSKKCSLPLKSGPSTEGESDDNTSQLTQTKKCGSLGSPFEHKSIEELEKELVSRLNTEQNRTKSSADTTKVDLKCGVIDCPFSTKDDVCFKLHHTVKHPNCKQLSCNTCQKSFEDVDILLSHLTEEHKTGISGVRTMASILPRVPEKNSPIFPCVIAGCETSFNRVTELNNHFDQRHPDLGASMPCCFCYLSFKTRSAFVGHVQSHIKNIMKCSYCNDVYESKEELLAHIAVKHEGMPKRINICIKILNNERLTSTSPKVSSSSSRSSGAMSGAAKVKTEAGHCEITESLRDTTETSATGMSSNCSSPLTTSIS